MKKYLVLPLLVMGVLSSNLNATINPHSLMVVSGMSGDANWGLTKALGVGTGLWYGSDKFVTDETAKQVLKNLAVYLAVREGSMAGLDSVELKSWAGKLPVLGAWLQDMLWGASKEEKRSMAKVAGLVGMLTLPNYLAKANNPGN